MTKWRILRVLPPLALGVGVAVWLISGKQPPQRVERAERAVPARVLTVQASEIRPEIKGFGTVSPGRSWAAVAEVSGAVIYRDPALETGNMIPAGTVVLRIDSERYDTALAQVQADRAALLAEREQIEVEADNTRRVLGLEQSRLTLSETDLSRTRDLVAQGAAAKARQDEQERAVLQIRRTVQELQNTLALIPVRQARLAAQLAKTDAALAHAQRDLAMTQITVPFDLRVGQVSVEQYQFVSAGQPLVSGDGMESVEVTAQFAIESFPRLIGSVMGDGAVRAGLSSALTQIEAEVTLASDTGQVWPGRVLRVGNALDPQARSVPVVVEVTAPYADAQPPLRLPLVPNMYVQVTLTGPALQNRIVLPSGALHQGHVYLRDGQGRLDIRPVTVDWHQNGVGVIADGVAAGEQVILDDIVPALPGILIQPVETGQ